MYICKECFVADAKKKHIREQTAKEVFDCHRKSYGPCEVCKKPDQCIEA